MRFMFFKDRMCGFKDWAWVGFTRKENFGGVGIASRAIMGQSGLGVGTGRVFRCGRYFLCQSQLKKPHDIPFMHPSTISFATPFSLSLSHTHHSTNRLSQKHSEEHEPRGETRASERNTSLSLKYLLCQLIDTTIPPSCLLLSLLRQTLTRYTTHHGEHEPHNLAQSIQNDEEHEPLGSKAVKTMRNTSL